MTEPAHEETDSESVTAEPAKEFNSTQDVPDPKKPADTASYAGTTVIGLSGCMPDVWRRYNISYTKFQLYD